MEWMTIMFTWYEAGRSDTVKLDEAAAPHPASG
jgi:hypothetical protein